LLKVGITGGIGSGKTYVSHMFNELGIPVYYADKEAKRLMFQNKALKDRIKTLLGKESYHRNGRLNRGFVASKIFGDKKLLAKINSLVHPAVHLDFQRWAKESKKPIVMEESAIIFENNLVPHFDKVIIVTADKEIRIRRVMNRDKTTRKQVLARMDKQFPDKKKVPLADFVICNNGYDNKDLHNQVKQVYHELSIISKKKK